MPNFEDMNDQKLVDGDDDEDDYSNDLIYQENHCYSMQTNNQKNIKFYFKLTFIH